VKQGFRGPIYATAATADLCGPMLRDTAHIAESDADFAARHNPDDPPPPPLFGAEDVEATLPLFHPVDYHKPFEAGPGLTVEFQDAGHILGSATVLLTDGKTRLAFSGDVGRPGLPIIRDPEPLPPVDYLIMESTYGNRVHPPQSEATGKLESVVQETIAGGGRLIVPAFAVGRTQQLVLLLHQLMNAGRLPSIPIFVDSPLAVNVTEVFRAHPECFDAETYQFISDGKDPFGFKRLIYIRDSAESRKLNDLHGPFIVISPSGMCEAGRVLHHLRHNIGDARNTILLTGYQAENTLGRKLRDGMKSVRIFGLPAQVRARVDTLDELSGHGDSGELLTWMAGAAGSLKRVFLVHGETPSSTALAGAIQQKYRVQAKAVLPGEQYDL